jgi:beta-hydroxylase
MDRYGFMKSLEDNHEIMYEEFLAVQEKVIPWPETHLHEGGWRLFGLYLGPDYQYIADAHEGKLQLNEGECPVTRELIKRYAPFHGSVGFSILKANSEILPHSGVESHFRRMHLALKVPEGDLGFQVEDQDPIRWEVGKSFHFDGEIQHRAWNRSDEDRVILLLDFDPEAARTPV